MPCTPISSSRRMKAGSNPGVRTIGVMPTRSAAITASCTSCRSKLVCSMSMKAASKPANPISSTICGSAMPPTWVPKARPPSRRMRLTRFSFMFPLLPSLPLALGRSSRLRAAQAGNDHVGVQDIAESIVKGGQRRIVQVLAQRGITVADHDRAEVHHIGVARRAFAAYIGHRPGDQHRIEASRPQPVGEVRCPGHKGAVAVFLDDLVFPSDVELRPQLVAQRTFGKCSDTLGSVFGCGQLV